MGSLVQHPLMPRGGASSLREHTQEQFDPFRDRNGFKSTSPATWKPAVDVSESNDALTLRADIPGVEIKNIQLSLEDNILTLRGEKKIGVYRAAETFHQIERSSGAFVRSFRLPVAVEGAELSATFEDGVLVITLPKASETKGRAHPVRNGVAGRDAPQGHPGL